MLVTVDWEGRDLLEPNLQAMEAFRTNWPNVPLVHFLNAAYFTKPRADAELVTTRIERALSSQDERGLHLHGWKSLFEASGVTFRNTPTVWDAQGSVTDCAFDCGHEVPISAYTAEELEKVLRFSRNTLEQRGFGQAKSFRAGAWLLTEPVRTALGRLGFANDNSAVFAKHLSSEIGERPLYALVLELWKDTTPSSQPFGLELPSAKTSLLEIPDNGALADYMSAEEMFAVYAENRDLLGLEPAHSRVVSIGFHQETANEYLARVDGALTRIFDDVERLKIPFRVVTTDEIMRRFSAR